MGMRILGLILLSLCSLHAQKRAIPKAWDERALKDWATPVAGLNVRPGHFTEKEYYAAPVDNVRTYPVYYPGHEPAGYWGFLNTVGEKPLIEPAKLKTDKDWIEAGKRVFEESDVPVMRRVDPKLTEDMRSAEVHKKIGTQMSPDGTIFGVRWVPTSKGLALGVGNCAGCHTRYIDGQWVNGAGFNFLGTPLVGRMAFPAASPVPLEGDSIGMGYYRNYGVPWVQNDIHERFKTMERKELGPLFGAAVVTGGGFPRWGGSPYYTTKVPDLIGFKDRKYIDHTATHQHRNIGDLMRYAALVTFAEAYEFGPHRILRDDQRKIYFRQPDEALYALALYIYSLQPPPNPNKPDEKSKAGEKIFRREGCIGCHTPPFYTNNKLTLAEGFTQPADKPKTLDVLEVSVGTDPGLALKTRKGTGYYKVPSLKGVWYRGHYLHDGSAASLEEMFDPDRLQDTHVRGGFHLPGQERQAIRGHEFGLKLPAEERAQLIAFLKTL